MLTVEGLRAHGLYGNAIDCVDETVNTYLATGTLPHDDTSCRG